MVLKDGSVELGHAIGVRARECAQAIHQRRVEAAAAMEISPSHAYHDHSWARQVVGTLLIARWLITGQGVTEDEYAWISLGGSLAAEEGLPIGFAARDCLYWRDALAAIVEEESDRLRIPAQTRDLTLRTIARSCDATLLRIASAYDRQLQLKTQALKDANRHKSEFLANVSHELRTPLSAILGFTEILLEGMDGELSPEMRQDLLEIQRSGQSLLTLINDILDLAKIEAGRMTLELGRVELAAVVESVVSVLRPLAERRSLWLRARVPKDAAAMADEVRLRQILTNLVGNAIKFTERGGVRVECDREGSCWRVAVTDTGVGISPQVQQRIFEEFEQGDSGTSRKHGGTGLGLAIARRLVALHGGELGLRSAPGQGSCFWFTLPALESRQGPAGSPAEVPSTAVSAPVPWPGQTADLVLVIDDEQSSRELICRQLRRNGYRTAEAASAEEGIRLAHQLHPAAITLDAVMPGPDGWQALHTLRQDPRTRDIPVLMITGVDDCREPALTLGAAGYLTKPFTSGQLLGTLSGMLPTLAGADVLCVDDDPSMRELLTRALAAAGVRVRTASSARQALAEVERRMPDALLVDLRMPGMSGWDLITHLRQRPAMAWVPMIVLTAQEVDTDTAAAVGRRVDRFIPKCTLRLDELAQTLAQAIAHRRSEPLLGLAAERGLSMPVRLSPEHEGQP